MTDAERTREDSVDADWPRLILMARAWFEGNPDAALAELGHRAVTMNRHRACEYNGGACQRSGCAGECQALRLIRERRALVDAAEKKK